jgi:hypothetical protein
MKAKVDAKAFKSAIKAAQTLQNLSADVKMPEAEAHGFKGCLTVVEGGVVIDAGTMGAHVQLMVPATTLKEGEVGIDLNAVDKLRLSGLLVIEYENNSVAFTAGKTHYNIAADQAAVSTVKGTKPTDIEAVIIAKIPTKLLAQAAAWVAIKPTIKAESMRLQFTLRPGVLELLGSDHYCYGKFRQKNEEIKVRGEHKFVMYAASINTILNSIKGKTVSVGIVKQQEDEQAKMIRFKSSDADVYYPTLDFPFLDTSKVKKEVTSGVMNCKFTTFKKNIKDAIANVKIVGTPNLDMILVRVSNKDVKMAAQNGNNHAMDEIPASDCQAVGADAVVVHLSPHYLESIVNIIPDVVPLRFEAWNNKNVLIQTANTAAGSTEYLMNQIDPEFVGQEES